MLNIIFTIVGLFLTIVFGFFTIWGIMLAIRNRYPGQITFIKKQQIALFDEAIKSLPEFTIHLKGKPINPNIILMKGVLINSGKKDISQSMVEHPLSLNLPEDCKWLHASITNTSPEVVANFDQPDNSTVILKTGLFRCKEIIHFITLADIPVSLDQNDSTKMETSEHRFENLLFFKHRIQDTQAVKHVELEGINHLKLRLKFFLVLSLLMFSIGISFFTMLFWLNPFKQIAYSFRSTSNEIINVTASPSLDSNVILRSTDLSYNETIPVAQFFSRVSGTPTVISVKNYNIIILVLVPIIYVFMPIIILLITYKEYRTNKSIRRLLNIE